VYDVVAEQLLCLPQFQNLLLIVYDQLTILKRSAQLFSDWAKTDNSVWWA